MNRMNLTLHFQITDNDIAPRSINVRSSLMVANLIDIVKNKFNLVGNYELRLRDSEQALDPGQGLDQLGVQDGGELACVSIRDVSNTLDLIDRGLRMPFEQSFKRVYLLEQRLLKEYDLLWQPAIIGRRNRQNPHKNRLLAVDLDGFEDLPTVSRHHACITEQDGAFFLESIHLQNPTYLDDVKLQLNVKLPLHAGSTIRVGKVQLIFNLIE
jgi:hypothetical protein